MIILSKKKKKASKMPRTSKKPVSVTILVGKKPICQMKVKMNFRKER